MKDHHHIIKEKVKRIYAKKEAFSFFIIIYTDKMIKIPQVILSIK